MVITFLIALSHLFLAWYLQTKELQHNVQKNQYLGWTLYQIPPTYLTFSCWEYLVCCDMVCEKSSCRHQPHPSSSARDGGDRPYLSVCGREPSSVSLEMVAKYIETFSWLLIPLMKSLAFWETLLNSGSWKSTSFWRVALMALNCTFIIESWSNQLINNN